MVHLDINLMKQAEKEPKPMCDARKNEISRYWPKYMIKQYTACRDKSEDPIPRASKKTQLVSQKLGISYDNPFKA